MPKPICEVFYLECLPYNDAWSIQKQIAAQVARNERSPALLLLEHPHTYTFGRRGRSENLLWDEFELARRGVSVHWVDRGGDVTYHGPGQLVGYPILPLAPGGLFKDPVNGKARIPQADYVGYVRNLEKSLIKTLAGFGIVSGQMTGLTGVWVQPDVASRCPHCPPDARKRPSKIAAIGVKVDARGVSQHGFALNISTNMEFWNGIIGCGLDGYPVINLADLLWEPPEISRVIDELVNSFGETFGFEMAMKERMET